jgi:hypothetical protein
MSVAGRISGERLHESRMREICTSGSTRGEGRSFADVWHVSSPTLLISLVQGLEVLKT